MIPLANHSGCKQTRILYLKKIRVSRGKQTENRENKKSLRFLKMVTTERRTERCPGVRECARVNCCLALCSKYPVIARPVRTLVVAIPRLERKCSENFQEDWDSPRFLVAIVTWFLSTGGLPHQSADWFAMTVYTRQTPIYPRAAGKKHGGPRPPMSPRFGRDTSNYDLHEKAGGLPLPTITAPNVHPSSKRGREVCKQAGKSNFPSKKCGSKRTYHAPSRKRPVTLRPLRTGNP